MTKVVQLFKGTGRDSGILAYYTSTTPVILNTSKHMKHRYELSSI